MSGETEKDVSGWTTDTLAAHIASVIDERDNRYQQRWEAQVNAVDAALLAQRAAIDAALIAVDKATSKAEQASEKRFESVNEFRQTLTDQAATFMPRAESLSLFERNSERIQEIMKRLDSFVDRDTVLSQYNQVMAQVNKISELQSVDAGRGAGLNSAWLYILGAIAALGTIVSLYLVLKS